MKVRIESVLPGVLCAALLVAPAAAARNLHLIDQDAESGFALYRMGKPSAEDLRRLCEDLGIQHIAVLSGNQEAHEAAYRAACPSNLRAVYNHRQRVDCALTSEFLEEFDRWIAEARERGWKIAFRCNCGCHRTGRLAAYYQMKHLGLSAAAALADMREKGKRMWWHMRRLRPQVLALESYIDGVPCELEGEERKYCVDSEGPGTEACAEARRVTRICWDEGTPASTCGLRAGGG